MLVVELIECLLRIENVRDLIIEAHVTYGAVVSRLTKRQTINKKGKKSSEFS